MKLIIDIPKIWYDSIMNEKSDVLNAEFIKNGIPIDSIIADIEAARDKDKLCEYPYNRCIDILRRADK